jgi:hypothetical protein
MGCAVLLMVVGCAGVRSQAPQKEKQGHTEATASEEARCEETRLVKKKWRPGRWTTNDVPGCPKGGLLTGTDGIDKLYGKDGDDEIHSLGAKDWFIYGGYGDDVIYGGPGDDIPVGGPGDDVIYGGAGGDEQMYGSTGEDVIYGGDGSDGIFGGPGEDVLYGGEGDDWVDGRFYESAPSGGRRQRDKLYCGEGMDSYDADEKDYVDSSCEKKSRVHSVE